MLFLTDCSSFVVRQGGREVKGAGVVIWWCRVQGLHPANSGICFSVVPSLNPRSRFLNSQLNIKEFGLWQCIYRCSNDHKIDL